jgi:urease accessory protein
MRILLAILGSLVSTAAFAHTGHADAAGLMHGFMHPVGGLDHVLAMVAVGVLAFLTGGRMRFALPLSFMCAMLFGGLIGAYGFEAPVVETAIGLSIIVLAGLAACGAPLPHWAALAITGFFGVFHGLAHGAEMPVDTSGFAYGVGFIAATAIMHACGFALAGACSRATHGKTFARRLSAGVALVGASMLFA